MISREMPESSGRPAAQEQQEQTAEQQRAVRWRCDAGTSASRCEALPGSRERRRRAAPTHPPGPGDTSTPRGFIASISTTVLASLGSTTYSHPRLPRYCGSSSSSRLGGRQQVGRAVGEGTAGAAHTKVSWEYYASQYDSPIHVKSHLAEVVSEAVVVVDDHDGTPTRAAAAAAAPCCCRGRCSCQRTQLASPPRRPLLLASAPPLLQALPRPAGSCTMEDRQGRLGLEPSAETEAAAAELAEVVQVDRRCRNTLIETPCG